MGAKLYTSDFSSEILIRHVCETNRSYSREDLIPKDNLWLFKKVGRMTMGGTKGKVFAFIPRVFFNLLWFYLLLDEIVSANGLKNSL